MVRRARRHLGSGPEPWAGWQLAVQLERRDAFCATPKRKIPSCATITSKVTFFALDSCLRGHGFQAAALKFIERYRQHDHRANDDLLRE
jgi:hypothetical protein